MSIEVLWKPLYELDLDDMPRAGGKAARLGHLARAGLSVPDGFVLLADAEGHRDEVRDTIRAALMTFGPGPVAVRSSSTQEDLSEASFAGQYESVLDVGGGEDEVMAAVVQCWQSATAPRVESYARSRGGAGAGAMAVLVQRMIRPDAAGVAYSANPVTGARDEVVISAVPGLGERLVSGDVSPDEWVVRGGEAKCTRAQDGSIDATQAMEIAQLARRVGDDLGGHQDIEWAIDSAGLHLLQARPMTALPDEVRWESPVPGGYGRHFRFGEWIGDPVTPLFESWLLSRMEDALHAQYKAWSGISAPGPYHVVINGWYFYMLPPIPEKPLAMARMMLPVLPKLLVQPRRVAMLVPPTAHVGIELFVKEWRDVALPQYLGAVAAAELEVETAPPSELIELIDNLAQEAGLYFAYLTAVAGFAAKAEFPLGRFYQEHLHSAIAGSHLEFLQGLVDDIVVQPHAVQSLDWYFPTQAEMGTLGDEDPAAPGRRQKLVDARNEAERRARAALADSPGLGRTFEKLIATAQRFQPLREECVSHFTRSWPVMRRALSRLANDLSARGALDNPADIHFLTRDELILALDGGPIPISVSGRQATWERQRRLSPPLLVGQPSKMFRKIVDDYADATRAPSPARGIRGVAASPGRAVGAVRVLRDQSEFDQLQPGEILVASATTPAWTPLFAIAAAVVTDTGSIGSHASQVAREYGIPAVVCTGDATRQLTTGQVVTVDGSAGLVELGV